MDGGLRYLDASAVRQALHPDALRDALAHAFVALSEGRASAPTRIQAHAPAGFVGAMPGYVPGGGLAIKAVSIFPGNHGGSLPSHQGLVVAFDEADGRPIAILDAATITELRTAAAAALAADLLARPDARTLAIVGAGVQGAAHLDALAGVRAWAEVRVASRDGRRAAALAGRSEIGRAVDGFEAAVRGADVVCLCTDAPSPVIDRRWLDAGAHVSSVGRGRELDGATVDASRVFVEWRGAVTEAPPAGAHELQGRPPSSVTELGDVLRSAAAARGSADEITVYKSTGHAVEDVAATSVAIAAAVRAGLGQVLGQ